MDNRLIAIMIASSGLLLAGCGTGAKESNPSGVRTMLIDGQLRTLDLAGAIDSFSSVQKTTSERKNDEKPIVGEAYTKSPAEREADAEIRLNNSIAGFYSNVPAAQQAQRRNEIQARIVAAANQRCGLWKNKFAHGASLSSFWFGTAAAATTAAATAFSPESTKEALTALASTASGAGAQYEKSYLFNQTLSVIFQGIDTRRQDILERISKKNLHDGSAGAQAPTSMDIYPLSSAIADALEYHSACTAASGLQKASEALADQRPTTATATTTTTPVPKPVTPPSIDAKPTAAPI